MNRGLILLLAVFFPLFARAHVGSPNVFFEGKAGPYPVRVIIKPPSVVPGLAEINVRVEGAGVQQVTALPVFWRTGKKGAPPPDVAEAVRGETNLYAATLWLMSSGAYSIEVEVSGALGKGSVGVPVNSVAMTRREMSVPMAVTLGALGAFLFFMAVKLAGVARGESLIEPGAEIPRQARVRARAGMVLATVLYSTAVAGGRYWWNEVDADYRNNRLYRAIDVKADVRMERSQRILRLAIQQAQDPRRDFAPILPDHGKIMHMFLVREPELDAFAHIHPIQRDKKTFEVALPPLPAGSYRAYADITHESGFSQTLVATAEIPPGADDADAKMWALTAREPVCATPQSLNGATNLFLTHDGDDSWHVGRPEPAAGAKTASLATTRAPAPEQTCRLANGCTMVWERNGPLIENREATLRFKVRAADQRAVLLETYMGMVGHAAVRRTDGAVFAHLHPMGTISMASQQYFEKRDQQGAPPDTKETHPVTRAEGVSFPYEFPRAGAYRIWVQVKSEGKVYTGVFDAEVEAKR